jgi:hypothetical protein
MGKVVNVSQKRKIKLLNVPRFILAFVIGFIVSSYLSKIPSEGGSIMIPASPLVFVVLVFSAAMLYGLRFFFTKLRNSLVFIAFIIGYTSVMYLSAVVTLRAVSFNGSLLECLQMFVCLVTVMPFIEPKISIIDFEGLRAPSDSIYFATSIMWLSPFFAEMLILFRWLILGQYWLRMSYMVLGGNGINDILFFFGFWIFLTIFCFHLLGRILFKKSDQPKDL